MSRPSAFAVSRLIDELERRRLLDGQLAGRFAPQEPVRVGGQPDIGRALVRAVAHKPARLAVLAPAEHRGQAMRRRELGDLGPVHHRDPVREDEHGTRA